MFFYQRRPPSSRLQQPHGVVAFEKGEAAPGGKALFGFEVRIAQKQVSGEVGRAVHKRRGLRPLRDAEARIAALARPQHLAAAAQAKILLRDHKPVLDLPQDIEARLCRVGQRRLVEQDARGLRRPSSDAAAQLMELGEAEHLGVLDDHHGRRGDVDADLNDGGGDKDRGLARGESGDGGVFLGA